jgi:DNA recombination protein RmuC
MRKTYTREDGSRAQPDVVIRLPEDRSLVVDSKVSLTAYEEYASSENEADRAAALARHLGSMHAHIQNLSDKSYQSLPNLNSVDFQIMFVPVEPAFMLAIANDSRLWEDAWRRNVLLVSPSNLLFVLRTVNYLLRQEQQSINAQDIAERGAVLYDKLVGFVQDLDALGDRLRQARESYDSAYGKFSTGRGNVIRQAEMLKSLGVKPNKSLPQVIVEAALDEPLKLPSATGDGNQVKPE